MIVIDPPVFDLLAGIVERQEPVGIEALVPEAAVERFNERQTLNRPDITVRPLAGTPPMLSTYLLRRSAEPSEPMKRFLQRAREEFLPKGDEPAS